ncbi:hypothetical protein P692DRAFT_20734739, partial [Suillus brevipes Sb2]
RASVISEMLKLTASLLKHALSSGLKHASMRRSPLIGKLGVNYRFSNIVLDEFAMSAEGRPIKAFKPMRCSKLGTGRLRHPRCCRWGAENLA